MMKAFREATFVLLAALLLAPVVASAHDIQAQVDAMVSTPLYRQHMASTLRAQVERVMPSGCPAQLRGDAAGWSPDVRFSPSGMPDLGWVHITYVTDSCDATRTFNLFVVAQANGEVRFVAGLPGSTKADLHLQIDALQIAGRKVRAASFTPDGCEDIWVLDTRFDEFTGPVDPTSLQAVRPSRETWRYYLCGREGSVDVRFVPDATGTAISVSERQGSGN